jgi:hypothetical protein
MWEMAMSGEVFPTFTELANKLPDEFSDRDNLTLVLDWEIPEFISQEKKLEANAQKSMNFEENVVFLSSGGDEGGIIEAGSLSEYLSTLGR